MNQLDFKRISADADRQARRQLQIAKTAFTVIGAVLWLVFTIIGWSIMAAYFTDGIPDQVVGGMTIMTVGWLVTVIYSVLSLFFDTRAAQNQTRGQVMGRAINAELVRLGMNAADLLDQEQEKQKRGVGTNQTDDQTVRLSDDGELLTEAEVVARKTRANG